MCAICVHIPQKNFWAQKLCKMNILSYKWEITYAQRKISDRNFCRFHIFADFPANFFKFQVFVEGSIFQSKSFGKFLMEKWQSFNFLLK